MIEKPTAEHRAELTELLADGNPADKAHLDNMTEEQFATFLENLLATRLRIDSGELRRVTLSDGSGVLVDGDCEHTDAEIRVAVERVN
jgi:hypothetical protein